jgi:hypothetical protein
MAVAAAITAATITATAQDERPDQTLKHADFRLKTAVSIKGHSNNSKDSSTGSNIGIDMGNNNMAWADGIG